MVKKHRIQQQTSTSYCSGNNQAAESAVGRVKTSFEALMDDNPHLKVNDHEIQSLIHDLAHANMKGQQATAHQALYFSFRQDAGIEINHRAD